MQPIATPESFRGKSVQVEGFGVVEFEFIALMMTEEDAEYLRLKNGIWLALTPDQFQEYEQYSGRQVLVEGVFDPDRRGHLGMWSGALIDVARLEPLLSIDELQN